MTNEARATAVVCCAWALLLGESAQAQYLLSPPNNGGQLQIGDDFALPAQAGVFLGGRTPVNGGTMGGGPIPDGPGVAFWPPLLIGRNPASMGSIMQGLSTPQGGAVTLPAGVLANHVGTVPRGGVLVNGLFTAIPRPFHVRTSIDYAWPDVAAVFAPGGGPGIPGTPVLLSGPGGGTVTYNAGIGAKVFGGAAQFALTPGPFAGSFQVQPNSTGALPAASLWFNLQLAKAPPNITLALLMGASGDLGVGGLGGVGTMVSTTMFGPVPFAIRQFTGMLGPNGTPPISMSMGFAPSTMTNMVTGGRGFPWTTGFITVTAGVGLGGEIFFLSGGDSRVAGEGNISMVSGALSLRRHTGANANRGWVTLTVPELATSIGAVAAIAALALSHALAQRRPAATPMGPASAGDSPAC